MKKIFCILLICTAFVLPVFSQSNSTVDINDDIYLILKNAEMRGLCETLPNVKPYTQNFIIKTIDTIINNLDGSTSKYKKQEIEQLEFYKQKISYEEGLDLKKLLYRQENEKDGIPISFNLNLSEENFVSSGFYDKSSLNSFGYEAWGNLNIFGDIGNNLSYKVDGFVELTKMPLKKLGTYEIGYWWDWPETYENQIRTINKWKNYAVLPFSYKKHWDGSIYYLENVSASGLEGWPDKHSFAFGMLSEIHGTYKDGLIDYSAGRINREWGAMDNGSSLVFNQNARPMFALEASANLFDWLSFSTLTGFLEFPNQRHVAQNAWYITDEHDINGENKKMVKDSYFFHNIFSIGMLDLNFKYVHWDFGSTVVMPNRFELGYSFPLLDRVVYQNNVGDYDNLALFSNLKLQYPGIGYIWGSFYLDEMNSISTKLFENTRCMFAYQGGMKVAFPFLPFTSVSIRYTKVEPYCYTHTALSPSESQPYFSHFLSESYTNNGESLGYYLPPNADELNLRIETMPLNAATFSFGYQLIRHGVDWGSQSSMFSGSSIWSELITRIKGSDGKEINRGHLRKYFLHDGTYEWYNIFNIKAAYDLNSINLPIQVYCNIGYVHNWFTSINGQKPSKSTKYEKFSNSEYLENRGCVISVGLNLFKL